MAMLAAAAMTGRARHGGGIAKPVIHADAFQWRSV